MQKLTQIFIFSFFLLPALAFGDRYHEVQTIGTGHVAYRRIAKIGDLNADGVSDFAVSEYVWSGSDDGQILVYSGANRSLLGTKAGSSHENLGYGLDAIGDVNADGKPDILVGARGRLVLNPSLCPTYNHTPKGAARILSGANLSTWLLTINRTNRNTGFGYDAVAPADYNSDGIKDMVIPAPYDGQNGGDPCDILSGSVLVYSGSNGSLLNSFAVVDAFATPVGTLGDINGDGIVDFAYYAYNGTVGRHFSLRSGANYSELATIPTTQSATVGFSIRGIGDLTGDGKSEFAIGVPSVTAGDQNGTLKVYQGSNSGTFPLLVTLAGDTRNGLGSGFDSIADLNSDGIRDLIVSGNGTTSSVRIYSGAAIASGQSVVLAEHLASGMGNFLHEVDVLGDLDGDGIEDFAVSSLDSKFYVFLSDTPGTVDDPDPQDEDLYQITSNTTVSF